MRNAILAVAAVALLVTAHPARAQSVLSAAQRDSVQQWVNELAPELAGAPLPLDAATTGARSIPAGSTVSGDVLTVHGTVDVAGRVEGSVAAIDGNVILRASAVVIGSALAVGGTVVDSGASVGGEVRSVHASRPGILALLNQPTHVRPSTAHAIGLALAWFAILGVIGFAVLLLAPANLEAVAEVISRHFGRSFLIGVVGQILALPALVLLIVALAITLIGIVVIPLAVLAFMLGAAGALALGFVAMAYANGNAIGSARTGGSVLVRRGGILLTGLAIYAGIWLLAGAFTWAGVVGVLLRALASIVTWVAVTVGLGATISSRAGTRRDAASPVRELEEPTLMAEWQTPTPVSGVAAARRPTPAPGGARRS
ncbi:MAG TPA: polymer-forming cytoskeletal protein [Gemmatimonadaceae bacterium]|nr:polymer-forming cytoskeletal protein [Gemmatimonadaceae bacterium]